eukprot:scaffold2645_cov378-Prasinococcus_capsulatus_cf.AAC.22
MEVTCILFSIAPKMVTDPNKVGKKVKDYWEPSTKLLSDPTKFLDSLLSFDKDNISDAIISQMSCYMENTSFTPESVSRVSKACTSICMWARAMYTYNEVSKQVAPKRARLQDAQKSLEKTRKVVTVTCSPSAQSGSPTQGRWSYCGLRTQRAGTGHSQRKFECS